MVRLNRFGGSAVQRVFVPVPGNGTNDCVGVSFVFAPLLFSNSTQNCRMEKKKKRNRKLTERKKERKKDLISQSGLNLYIGKEKKKKCLRGRASIRGQVSVRPNCEISNPYQFFTDGNARLLCPAANCCPLNYESHPCIL